MASVLTLVQDFCTLKGLPTPSGLVGNTETTAAQLLAICQEIVEDLTVNRWEKQVKRVTFAAVATEVQGTVESLFGTGYLYLLPNTFWNVTLQTPVSGPFSDQEWQRLKTFSAAGSTDNFKIMGGNLHMFPVPTAGHTLSAMVATSLGLTDTTGATAKERFTVDSDIPLFPSNVFKAELEWRWLKRKDEAWAAAYERARGLVATLINKDNHLPRVYLDSPEATARPGIVIPPGSWSV